MKKLRKQVQAHPDFEITEANKIRCISTGHEMLADLENFQSYLKGPSYKRACQQNFSLEEYPYLTAFKGNPHFLFCQLTRKRIPKRKSAVSRHIGSPKFQSILKAIQSKKKEEQQEGGQVLEGQLKQMQGLLEQQPKIPKKKKAKAQG